MVFIIGFSSFVAGLWVRELTHWLQQKNIKKMEKQNEISYLNARGFDLEECNESHLPGDCPLCGGK